MSKEADGDFGNAWLKTNYAGSGASARSANGAPTSWSCWSATTTTTAPSRSWRASSTATSRRAPPQRLLLEKGDIDIARNLSPKDLDALASNKRHQDRPATPKGTVYYFGLNQKNPNLAKPEVREALEVSGRLRRDRRHHRQGHRRGPPDLPAQGLPRRASTTSPTSSTSPRPRNCWPRPGYPNGFTVTMDVRNIQPITGIAAGRSRQTLAQAGIKLEIIPGDGKQTLTKYRARTHDIYIGQWGAGLSGPAHQCRDLRAQRRTMPTMPRRKTLAWRNAWDIPELTKLDRGRACSSATPPSAPRCTRTCRQSSAGPARSSSCSSRPRWRRSRSNVDGVDRSGPTSDST